MSNKIKIIVLALIWIIAFMPLIGPIILISLLSLIENVDYANNTLAVIPWLVLYTFPIGFIASALWIILCLTVWRNNE